MRYPLAQMQAHATALLRAFEAAGAPSEALRATSFQSASWPGGAGAPVGEQAALALSARIYTHWMGLLPNTASARARARCEVARDALLEARRAVLVQRESLCTTLGAAAAEGIVRLRAMPPKLNPIVKALMNAEQARAAAVLANLLKQYTCRGATGAVSDAGAVSGALADKVVENLCKLLERRTHRACMRAQAARTQATPS